MQWKAEINIELIKLCAIIASTSIWDKETHVKLN